MMLATLRVGVLWGIVTEVRSAEVNLLENGGFEFPVVDGKTSSREGGNPTVGSGVTGWESLEQKEDLVGGKLTFGLTTEIARSGKQSLYLDFENLVAVSKSASLETKLISVEGEQAYKVAIWGRMDRKRPLALDERRPSMWLDVAFYEADGSTKSGEPLSGVEMIPGMITPGLESRLLFVSARWNESASEFRTPASAKFARITWSWIIPRDEGETDGIIYWDDASLVLLKPPPPAAGTVIP